MLALHSGSLALTMPPGADALLRLLQRAHGSVTVSYDPNARPLLMGSPERTRERVERLVALADVVKASVEDVAWLLPGHAAEEVAQAWLALGPALVAITCGADGVVAVAAGAGLLRRPARPITVVDTVGAGDAFTSALLAGLYRRGLLGAERRAALAAIGEATLTEVLDEAVLAAAITCTRPGADPPVLAELLG